MLAVLVAVATAQLVNKNVNRVVDLTTQIAKVSKCQLNPFNHWQTVKSVIK